MEGRDVVGGAGRNAPLGGRRTKEIGEMNRVAAFAGTAIAAGR